MSLHYRKLDVEAFVTRCEETLDKLMHPELDPALLHVHQSVLSDTATRIRQLMLGLIELITAINDSHAVLRDELAVYRKLKQSQNNCTEVRVIAMTMIEIPVITNNKHCSVSKRLNGVKKRGLCVYK